MDDEKSRSLNTEAELEHGESCSKQSSVRGDLSDERLTRADGGGKTVEKVGDDRIEEGVEEGGGAKLVKRRKESN